MGNTLRKETGKTWEFREFHNGMIGAIIVFRNEDDIDVLFEDGSQATHRKYSEFLSGHMQPDKTSNIVSFQVRKRMLGYH